MTWTTREEAHATSRRIANSPEFDDYIRWMVTEGKYSPKTTKELREIQAKKLARYLAKSVAQEKIAPTETP